MIQLNSPQDCCGCAACVQRCPQQCITMCEDEEGFLYPRIDTSLCIDCGLCEKTCPVLNPDTSHEPLKVFAAKNADEDIRRASSSGGVFTLLAEAVIGRGGVVFGARFDEHWEVEHAYTDTIEGLKDFRGSKYVQSRVGNTYHEAEMFLKGGREVLYSGTPCQIAGLRHYLRKEYTKLILVDFICHGVPSPGVFRHYLNETLALNNMPILTGVSFRDKRLGWKKYSFSLTVSEGDGKNKVILSESKYRNIFLKGFLCDLYLRPSCHACPFRSFRSGSDITIADFWAINDFFPKENDHLGYSLCILHSDIKIPCKLYPLDISKACSPNSAIYRSPISHKNRNRFFSEYAKARKVIPLIKKYATIPLKRKIILKIASILKN